MAQTELVNSGFITAAADKNDPTRTDFHCGYCSTGATLTITDSQLEKVSALYKVGQVQRGLKVWAKQNVLQRDRGSENGGSDEWGR